MLKVRHNFDIFGSGKSVVMHLRSTLSRRRYVAPAQDAEVENAVVFFRFSKDAE